MSAIRGPLKQVRLTPEEEPQLGASGSAAAVQFRAGRKGPSAIGSMAEPLDRSQRFGRPREAAG